MGLQISLGLQQQLIFLIVSLPLGLHPSPLRPSSFSTRGLCPPLLGPSPFSTWVFSLYLASLRILIIPSFLEQLPSNVQDHHRVQVPLPSFSCWLAWYSFHSSLQFSHSLGHTIFSHTQFLAYASLC